MPHVLQDILIICLASYATLDNQGITIINYFPVTVGLIAGLIMGDVQSAMMIAGTFQLMSLGVAGLGGASVPDYGLATIVGIYLANRTGADIGTAVAVGLPVGLLTIQLDVAIKIINNFFAHKSQTYAHQKEFKKMLLINWTGPFLSALKNFIPMILIVTVGPAAVKSLLDIIPEWVTNGLSIAGNILPIVGIGMLMHYMPIRKYLWALIIGFVLAAYLNMPILGVALIGIAFGLVIYNQMNAKLSVNTSSNSELEGDDFDE